MLHHILYIFIARRLPVVLLRFVEKNTLRAVLHMLAPAPQQFDYTWPCDFSQNLVSLMEEGLDGLGVSHPKYNHARECGSIKRHLGSHMNESLWRRGAGKSHVVEIALSLNGP